MEQAEELENEDKKEEDKYLMHKENEKHEKTVIVKYWMQGKHIFTSMYDYETSVGEMKQDLVKKFGMSYENLQILKTHIFLNDCNVLKYIIGDVAREINLTVVNTSSEIPFMLQDIVIPDIITVHIETEEIFKDITVEIEDRRITKPFIGGYSHKETGLEYHHAFTQTGPPRGKISPREKNSRDSQTKWLRNRKTEVSVDESTQMASNQICISTFTDKILTAKKYETADEREIRLNVLQKVKVIQRYWRAYKMKLALKVLHRKHKNIQEAEEKIRIEEKEVIETQKRKEILNKVFPRTRNDFGMLYAMVDRWKKAHINRIQKMSTPATKLAEFYLLLNKEIEMLSAIERQRHQVKKDLKILNEIKFFHSIGDPVKWKGYNGLCVSMDTIETQKGREFEKLYNLASNYNISKKERLEFLHSLRSLFKEHNCEISNELIKLLEREIELLMHKIDESKLDMLRKRIEQMLLRHMKTPECNEGVTQRLMKLKEQQIQMESYFCQRCQSFKLSTEFSLDAKNKNFKCCLTCSWDDKITQPWVDYTPYRFILHTIKREEIRQGSKTSVIFLLEEKDIQYIIERIWHCRSIISNNDKLDVLRLVRWDVNKDWSPWNCILLTEDEAKIHLEIRDLNKFYGKELYDMVLNKQLLGRVVFSNAFFLDEKFYDKNSKDAKNDQNKNVNEENGTDGNNFEK